MNHNLKELVENQKQAAAKMIDSVILKLPEGTSSGASRQLVDLIVGAALLEFAMLQSEAASNKEPTT
jgi:hypothetical protein